MKTVFLACLFVCVLILVLVKPSHQDCVYGGKTYADGEGYKEGCSFSCVCRGSDFSCLSMCPLKGAPAGCKMVENPNKDEANSQNCCPVEQC